MHVWGGVQQFISPCLSLSLSLSLSSSLFLSPYLSRPLSLILSVSLCSSLSGMHPTQPWSVVADRQGDDRPKEEGSKAVCVWGGGH